MTLSIIVLAAGKGTRMNSEKPKVFHDVGNYPMIFHVLDTAFSLKPSSLNLVISKDLNHKKKDIEKLYKKIFFSNQIKQLGTADAVKSAFNNKNILGSSTSLILYGDTPLITKQTLKKSLLKFKNEDLDISVLAMRPKDLTSPYGRLDIEKKKLKRIIEFSEASVDQKKIELCNSGIMIVKTKLLRKSIEKIRNNNTKSEFFLTDIVEIMSKDKFRVGFTECNFYEILGVNDKSDLSLVENEFQKIQRKKFLEKGVTLIDPQTVYFSYDTKIGRDVTIFPNVFIGPKVEIGDNVKLKSFSHIENSRISKNSETGPFVRTRNDVIIGENVKLGNFVEIKKSKIKKNVKVSHLSYVGDAEIGDNTNIGAGTITCNFDGTKKNKTKIEEDCFIGSNSSLIAPIKIKKRAIIGAGTVIDKDIPEGKTVYRKSELVRKNNKKK